jgi:hypothetical protein
MIIPKASDVPRCRACVLVGVRSLRRSALPVIITRVEWRIALIGCIACDYITYILQGGMTYVYDRLIILHIYYRVE